MPRKSHISEALVSLINGGGRHAWTLEDLHEELGRQGRPTDFSSVFRAAEKLAADGVVRKLLLEDGRARFETASAHHDHLYCLSCHTLVPVPCVFDRDNFVAVERATGVAIHGHNLILNGLCPDCRPATEPLGRPA